MAATCVAAATALATGTAPAAQAATTSGLLGGLVGVVGGVVGVVTTAVDTTTGLLGGADWGYGASQTSMSDVSRAVHADAMWQRGYTGKGVGVALIDTGVAPVPGLTSGNVVNGPDLSFDSQAPSLRDLDSYGHGTNMAGIIAGNDPATGFKGVAPGATLLSVKVGATDGGADVSQVIAAIDWIVAHRHDPGLNIRVINLSFGTDGTQSYLLDPLTHAVESAWRAGIVVVASGGNQGSVQPSLDDPAYDPFVIAVGADDTNGTASSLDDSVPDFSSRGSATRRVDVLAPGQSIVSLRDPGSYVDTEYPGARVQTRWFKGSGTSQAAAVVSGAVALLLQARPELTPNDVKALLASTAQPTPLADAAGRGAGLVDVAAAALALRPYAVQPWAPSTGLGSLDAARGTHRVADNGADLSGERDIFGSPWQPGIWAPASTAGTAWTGGTWNGHAYAGTCWCGTSWATRTWTVVPWSGVSWAGVSWASRSWSSRSWSSRSWSTGSWSTGSWSSRSWSSRSWSGAYWSSAGG
ncbi:MAG: S8 family serine peptidase [Frankiaceae bacterium]